MKNLRITTILLVILSWGASSAQERPDYLVTSKGDSLVGKVKILSFDTDQASVKVDGKKRTFPATQVVSLRMNDEVYRPQRRNGAYRFMKLLVPGYLSLYAFREANQNNYDSRWLAKRDGQTLEIPNLTFKKYMKEFLQDCFEVVKRIETNEYSRRNLEQIVSSYNSCIYAATAQRLAEAKMYVQAGDPKMVAFDNLKAKIMQFPDDSNRQNTLDLLADIKSKFSRTQPVPAYQITALKVYLEGKSVQTELDTFLEAIGKN